MTTIDLPKLTADTPIKTILENETGDVKTLCREGKFTPGVQVALLRAGITNMSFFLYTPLLDAKPHIKGLGRWGAKDLSKVLDELGFPQSFTSGTNPQSESLFLILNSAVNIKLRFENYFKALTIAGIYTVFHLSDYTAGKVRQICKSAADWQDFEALLTQKLAEEGLSFRAEQQES